MKPHAYSDQGQRGICDICDQKPSVRHAERSPADSSAPTNEAAERLRGMLPRIDGGLSSRLLDTALATERRNTVERIRERIEHYPMDQGDHEYGWKASVAALLDETEVAP